MKPTKKGKSLAMKLMDDLLNEEDTKSKSVSKKQSTKVSHDEESAVLDIAAEFSEESADLPPTPAQDSQSDIDSDIDFDFEVEGQQKSDLSSEDRTIKLSETKVRQASVSELPTKSKTVEKSEKTHVVNPRTAPTEVTPSVGKYAVRTYHSGALGGAEAALAQSENLRIAQEKILDLEKEIERLRTQNEELAAAGETLRRRADELLARAESVEARFQQMSEVHREEKEILLKNAEGKERESAELRLKIEELETRLSTNIQKIRVRERELENRLELVKMESSAIIRSKDEIVLDLKRQLDQLNLEIENYRAKGQELNRMLGDKQDILRRTVKTLRLALSMLEGGEEQDIPVKKAK